MANFVYFAILSLALCSSVAVARPGYAVDYYVSQGKIVITWNIRHNFVLWLSDFSLLSSLYNYFSYFSSGSSQIRLQLWRGRSHYGWCEISAWNTWWRCCQGYSLNIKTSQKLPSLLVLSALSLSLLQVSTRWLSPMAPFAQWTTLPIPFTVSMPWWPSLDPLCTPNRWLRSPLWPTNPFWPTTNHMWLLWLHPLWLPLLRPMVSDSHDWYIQYILPISD